MEIIIAFKGEKKFTATARGHQLLLDRPVEEGGDDKGMAPSEIFMASLAAGMGAHIIDCCNNIGIKPNGMILSVEWKEASNPARINNIKVEIKFSNIKVKEQQEAIIKAARHCLVRNTLQTPPKISVNLAEPPNNNP